MLPTMKDKKALPKKSAFARAVERFGARKEQRQARIGFIIDATSSRASTWEMAQVVQAKMFRAAGTLSALSLRLIYYGGNMIADCGWIDDPRAVAAKMAGVRCVAGYTQILPALRAFIYDTDERRPASIILVGDSFEENTHDAEDLALALKHAGIRVFSFLEGDDWTAESVFRRLADVTGGKFAMLGDDLPLADLCEGVALLTAGGEQALGRLQNGQAKQLLLAGPSRR